MGVTENLRVSWEHKNKCPLRVMTTGLASSMRLCELVFAEKFFLVDGLASTSPESAKTYDQQ